MTERFACSESFEVTVGNQPIFRGEFIDRTTDEYYDPVSVSFNVYDHKQVSILPAPIDITAFRISIGIFDYPYIIPAGTTDLFAEIKGTKSDSTFQLKRVRLIRVFND